MAIRRKLAFLMRNICLCLLVSFFLFGCSTKPTSLPLTPALSPTSNPITLTGTIVQSTPASTPTTPYACKWPPTHIPNVKAIDLYWLPNGKGIVYQNQEDFVWLIYSLSTGTSEGYLPEIDYTKTPDNSLVGDHIDIFSSPNGKYLVFTQKTVEGYDIFLSREKQKNRVYIGEIKGGIDKYFWMDNGRKLLFSIDWQSPLGAPEGYVYLLDLLKENITVIIPHSPEFMDISIFGITPNEDYILFKSYTGNNLMLRLWNINNGSIIDTAILPPLTSKWLPDDDSFIAVGYLSNHLIPSVYLYDIQDKSIEVLASNDINMYPYVSNAVEISPDLKTIAYIDESFTVNILDCVGINP